MHCTLTHYSPPLYALTPTLFAHTIGMNLKSGMEDAEHMFLTATIFSVALSSTIFFGGYIFIVGHGFDGIGGSEM